MKRVRMAVMLIFSLHASNLRAADDGMGWYDQDIWKNENRAFLWYPDAKKPKQAGQN
ncbi:thioredoxin family protein, partial [Neisseria gonorrhoeae]